MVETRSTTSNQNNDVPWSDLNDDVLFLVMMQLGVFDFLSFSGVCKSWRSLALSTRNRFLASRAPMSVRISPPHISTCVSHCACKYSRYLTAFEGRWFKTILPHCVGRECIGSICGYLILFGKKTKDFWLVNPITRHQLHFPDVPVDIPLVPRLVSRAILVFSPSRNGWVLVMLNESGDTIWFSVEGKGIWNHVSSPFRIIHIHAFNGKIYTLNYGHKILDEYRLCEMRLDPHPELTLLETKNSPKPNNFIMFVSSVENLYVVHHIYSRDSYSFHELDFGEMKWVSREKTRKEYAFFHSLEPRLMRCAFRQESWADTNNSWEHWTYLAKMWYFPHDCYNVNLINK